MKMGQKEHEFLTLNILKEIPHVAGEVWGAGPLVRCRALRVLCSEMMRTSAFTSSRTEKRTTLPAVGWPHTPWPKDLAGAVGPGPTQPPHAPPTSVLFPPRPQSWRGLNAPNLQLWAQHTGVDVRITQNWWCGTKNVLIHLSKIPWQGSHKGNLNMDLNFTVAASEF